MNIFRALDYKALTIGILESPHQRASQARLARHLGVHSTFVTHVLRGTSHFSLEQALSVTEFFSFSELETDYFVTLVNMNRAGTKQSTDYFKSKLDGLRLRGLELKEQLQQQTELSAEEQAVFYSDWTYSAVRLATALPVGENIEQISQALNLPLQQVNRIVDFLLRAGLCELKKGRLQYGTFSTYLEGTSPLIKRFHDNWRTRSLLVGSTGESDLRYTNTVTVSQEDYALIRDRLSEWIKSFIKIANPSEPEVMVNLCIDWLKVNR